VMAPRNGEAPWVRGIANNRSFLSDAMVTRGAVGVDSNDDGRDTT
jgi:hypothetical protein